MTLTEPESTVVDAPAVVDAPTRSIPLVPILAGALALSLVAVGALAVNASGDLGRQGIAACQATIHTMAGAGNEPVEISDDMAVQSLTQYGSTPGAARIDQDGTGALLVDESSSADVAERVAFYEERAAREAKEGIQSVVVSGTVTGNGQTDDMSCIASFRDGELTGLPGIWINIF